MNENYCCISVNIDEDGYLFLTDDRGFKVKGVRNLKVNVSHDDLTILNVNLLATEVSIGGISTAMCRGKVK
jgi:hypothetical protein